MESTTEQISSEEAQKRIAEYNADLLPRKFMTWGKVWLALLIIIFVLGLAAYARQLREGLCVTGMGDLVSWGIYISNFVFFVAVSLVGSLITAVLYLLDVKWRAPLTRIAEIIAVGAIIFAGLIIIVDMGRPDRIHHLLIYGRIQSPIVWDVIVVTTYMAISLLLLYFPSLPGMAFCRDNLKDVPRWQHKMYRILALGWHGTHEQFKVIKRAIRILAILIIPVALSIHTVTSWLFATTLRPGWDSTNFGPYFVSGAFMVGAAAVIAGMFMFRHFFRNYDKYITQMHFDHMGKLLMLLSLIYLYFNINEYLVPAYKMKGVEAEHLHQLFTGSFAPMFWSVQIGGMLIPIILLMFKWGRKPVPIFIISIMVIIGAWFKRFLIVIPTLLHPYLPVQEIPESWTHYFPTWEEWAITSGSVAGVLIIVTLFARYFPIISIWEIADERGVSLELIRKHAKLQEHHDEN